MLEISAMISKASLASLAAETRESSSSSSESRSSGTELPSLREALAVKALEEECIEFLKPAEAASKRDNRAKLDFGEDSESLGRCGGYERRERQGEPKFRVILFLVFFGGFGEGAQSYW